ncbi:MAG: tRNA lysidine(34) synthetase TilS [Saprospiraceae bacterium]|nr:tRNA lysidine(34) synthetase TilS [Saprospiraceae bacterium]
MNNIRKFIENSKLFSRTSRLLVAVSGGVDSMVLVHALHSSGYQIGLVHVNYKLRKGDSDLDEKLIRDYAAKHALDLHVHTNPGFLSKTNLQEQARSMRYSFFEQVRIEHKYDFVLTAHHADDVIESFIYNLSRGAGINGLKSIPEVNGSIIRPLLNFNKAEIQEYAKQYDVPHRIDLSNLEEKYDRNFIRNKILPEIEQRFPSFRTMVMRSIGHLKMLHRYYDKALTDWKKMKMAEKLDQLIISNDGYDDHVFVSQILADLGFHPETIQKILSGEHQPGKIFHNDTGGQLITDRAQFIFCNAQPNSVPAIHMNRSEKQVHCIFGNFAISESTMTKELNLSDHHDHCDEVFDLDNLSFPLVIRNWQAGDRIRPFGLQGKHKKVQDVFTDHKLNIVEKSKTPVVCAGNEIIWIPGLMRSDLFRVSDQTEQVLNIKWSGKDNGFDCNGVE